MSFNSAMEISNFVDAARITSNATLSAITMMDTLSSFEDSSPGLAEGWVELRQQLIDFPEQFQLVAAAMDAFLGFVREIRTNNELLERDNSNQARESLRSFHREIVMAGKAMGPLAAALYDFSPRLRVDSEFVDEAAEMLWRGSRLMELLMPDPLNRTEFLRGGTHATVHTFDAGFIVIHAGHIEGPLKSVRLTRIKQAIHGAHAALKRLSCDPNMAKSALVWPMRSPTSHFLDLAAASVLALKRHFTHLKLHVRRHMIRLDNALALGDVENARDALNLAIQPADEELLRKLVWSTKSLTKIDYRTECWRCQSVSEEILRPPNRVLCSQELLDEPILAPWW